MRGAFLGVPKINNEDYSIWGSILGSLTLPSPCCLERVSTSLELGIRPQGSMRVVFAHGTANASCLQPRSEEPSSFRFSTA